jgi:predicted Fe-Mo cluster-binding NifX family protein
MTCWKWFNGVLKEAGVKVTAKNEKKIDEVIHKYILANNQAMAVAPQIGERPEKK